MPRATQYPNPPLQILIQGNQFSGLLRWLCLLYQIFFLKLYDTRTSSFITSLIITAKLDQNKGQDLHGLYYP